MKSRNRQVANPAWNGGTYYSCFWLCNHLPAQHPMTRATTGHPHSRQSREDIFVAAEMITVGFDGRIIHEGFMWCRRGGRRKQMINVYALTRFSEDDDVVVVLRPIPVIFSGSFWHATHCTKNVVQVLCMIAKRMWTIFTIFVNDEPNQSRHHHRRDKKPSSSVECGWWWQDDEDAKTPRKCVSYWRELWSPSCCRRLTPCCLPCEK